MSEFDFGPGLRIEERIDSHEAEAIEDRWEHGRWLLSHVPEGKSQLPAGFVASYSKASGKSPRELRYRRTLAERFPSKSEVCTAVQTYQSWTDLREAVLTSQQGDGNRNTVEPGPLPEGIFRTVVADPPWQYGNTSTRGAAEDHYGTMTIEELCELPVEDRSAPDSHLYLWTTNNFLREAFDVMDAWGFAYKTCLTWVKPQMGMGNYFRGVTEHVLFGTRGKLAIERRDLTNVINAKRGKHSAKPGAFYELVENASPGPYLEMFARESRLGEWSYWGNESLENVEVA